MTEQTLAKLPEMNALWQQTLNWQPTEVQQQQFQRLYELILEGNQHLNLTRITEPAEFWEKHLWDSLRGIVPLLQADSSSLENTANVIDIGTGAGFPGLPIAMALPQLSLTLLDSTRKKISFVDTLISSLELQNVSTLVGRAEQLHRQFPQTYNFALLRAVASASVCAKYALPLLKTGGLAILYRGHWSGEEETSLQAELPKLKGEIESVEAFKTPLSESVRHCVYLRKVANPQTEVPRPVKSE